MKRYLVFLMLLVTACHLRAQDDGATSVESSDVQDRYVKHLVFPEHSTLNQKVEMAAKLVPTQQQLEWHDMEFTAFLHFGMNTFTDKEWGDGKENPALFNPTDFDADQWVRTFKEAGFKMLILTAKHHDGFCLWQTKTTDHSVASSPWKNGRGDVVREVSEACARNGLKFGVYLSPWDRHAPCYGDSPEYNKYFVEQLTELLTNYGEIYEVWFDGACGEGPNGKVQKYDWDAFCETIHKLQPNAVMAIMGDDVRWVGNEKGIGREMEWSATVITPGVYARAKENNKNLGIRETTKSRDLGSRDMLEKATELFWYPSEVDVSIRPGWFYHPDQSTRVKSLKHLVDIYFQSIGYNSVLLLNVPPDTRGRIHSADSLRLGELARYVGQTFAKDYVVGEAELWEAAGGESKVYELESGSRINVVMLQENIANGQRVDSFAVEALVDGQWQPLCEGTTIGHKRLLRFPAVEASALRLNLKQTRTTAEISKVGAFYAEEIGDEIDYESLNDIPRDNWKDHTGRSPLRYNPLIIDLGETVTLSGFAYLPDEDNADLAYHYTLEVSKNRLDWKTVVENGEFGNIVNNPIPQKVSFKHKTTARYIRLKAYTASGKGANVKMEEIGVLLAK